MREKIIQMILTLPMVMLLFWGDSHVKLEVLASEEMEGLSVREQYEEYEARFEAIKNSSDIENNGFRILDGQVFQVVFESFGEEPVTFMVAKDETYNRIAIFLADKDEQIIYKYNRLETNNRVLGQMWQNTEDIAAVSFVDLNDDAMQDVILISKCRNDLGEYSDKTYKIGDVLFQGDQYFYRDYRISQTINRFGMNKSAKCVVSYVRDNISAEFLYTATTKEELLKKGFETEDEQCYYRDFEKLGRLQVMPGSFKMGDYNIFMVYLIDTKGNIVWSFQPMGDYDNLYALRGISGKDVDGDGMKDIVVLAKYSYESPEGKWEIAMACSVYYQRTGGFDVDTEFVEQFVCPNDITMEALVNEIRAFWGWETEEVTEYMKQKKMNEAKDDQSTDSR